MMDPIRNVFQRLGRNMESILLSPKAPDTAQIMIIKRDLATHMLALELQSRHEEANRIRDGLGPELAQEIEDGVRDLEKSRDNEQARQMWAGYPIHKRAEAFPLPRLLEPDAVEKMIEKLVAHQKCAQEQEAQPPRQTGIPPQTIEANP